MRITLSIKNMNYKLLCSDLDGTLLSTKNDVSDFTIAQIARIKNDLRVILVSARMPRAMTYLQKRLGIEDQAIICYNGAYILDGEKEILSVTIALDLLEKIYQLAEPYGIKLGLYYKDEWYVEENSERVEKEIKYTKNKPAFRSTAKTFLDWQSRAITGAHKVMLMGDKHTTDQLYQDLEIQFSNEIAIYRSNDTLIELAPKSVSKLTAIQSLLQAEETLKDVLAFGDNYNDFDMLKYAGYGVAVGNGRESVKKIADYVCAENTQDGVAKFVKEHL